jgi:hypothetical protein
VLHTDYELNAPERTPSKPSEAVARRKPLYTTDWPSAARRDAATSATGRDDHQQTGRLQWASVGRPRWAAANPEGAGPTDGDNKAA